MTAPAPTPALRRGWWLMGWSSETARFLSSAQRGSSRFGVGPTPSTSRGLAVSGLHQPPSPRPAGRFGMGSPIWRPPPGVLRCGSPPARCELPGRPTRRRLGRGVVRAMVRPTRVITTTRLNTNQGARSGRAGRLPLDDPEALTGPTGNTQRTCGHAASSQIVVFSAARSRADLALGFASTSAGSGRTARGVRTRSSGTGTARADRHLRRADAAGGAPGEPPFDQTVLQRVVGDGHQPPTGSQQRYGVVESRLDGVQLPVDRYPQRLERPSCRVAPAAGGSRNRGPPPPRPTGWWCGGDGLRRSPGLSGRRTAPLRTAG
ncbi:MAG: hypothetical protein KatS3mg011_1822 [Acidimicrobiia bacterium]|nr:MAG: hypothetical protein KatS3mg011_1822 [Acidimicrobiia bacterium]